MKNVRLSFLIIIILGCQPNDSAKQSEVEILEFQQLMDQVALNPELSIDTVITTSQQEKLSEGIEAFQGIWDQFKPEDSAFHKIGFSFGQIWKPEECTIDPLDTMKNIGLTTRVSCGTVDSPDPMLHRIPVYQDLFWKLLNSSTQSKIYSRTYRIPVMFHVILQKEKSIDHLMSQIDIQFDTLRSAFQRRGNAPEISFDLVGKKIHYVNEKLYKPYSLEIVDYPRFITFADSVQLPAEKYLNVYILDDKNGESVLHGQANFPWVVNDKKKQNLPYVDGAVVVLYTLPQEGYFKGNTLIHEVGHYLGLFHTFGQKVCNNSATFDGCDCGDLVDDTPDERTCSKSCIALTCENNEIPRHNYMSYAQESCKTTFTKGQYERMILAIERFRKNFVQETSWKLID